MCDLVIIREWLPGAASPPSGSRQVDRSRLLRRLPAAPSGNAPSHQPPFTLERGLGILSAAGFTEALGSLEPRPGHRMPPIA